MNSPNILLHDLLANNVNLPTDLFIFLSPYSGTGLPMKSHILGISSLEVLCKLEKYVTIIHADLPPDP